MPIIRFLGSAALWIGALLGVAAGTLWLADHLGYVQPMVVISGSMEPDIMTGDLLIGRYTATDQVRIGDVLSVPSELTGTLVTHRVTSIEPLSPTRADHAGIDLSEGPRWALRMKGDANADGDLEPYFPGDRVLTPWVQIPQAGKIVSKLMEPSVAVPILLSLLALLGMSLLDEEPRRAIRRTIHRGNRPCPILDELDRELAAFGVDVRQFEMDHLDLALVAAGIDVNALDPRSERTPALTS